MERILPHINGTKLLQLLKKNDLQFKPGSWAQEGDIVICSQTKNWSDPDDMGKVIKVAPKGKTIKLPKGHRDGSNVHMYVQTYTKMRKPKKKLTGCLYTTHFVCLFVFFSFFKCIFIFFF